MTDKRYINRTYPTAWCGICGPGECEHNAKLNAHAKRMARRLSDDLWPKGTAGEGSLFKGTGK